jgi:hypothetical protein
MQGYSYLLNPTEFKFHGINQGGFQPDEEINFSEVSNLPPHMIEFYDKEKPSGLSHQKNNSITENFPVLTV